MKALKVMKLISETEFFFEKHKNLIGLNLSVKFNKKE